MLYSKREEVCLATLLSWKEPLVPLAIAIFPHKVEAMLSVEEQEPRYIEFDIPEGWIDPETSLVWVPEKLGAEIRRELKKQRLFQKKAYVGIPGAIIRQTHLPLPFTPSKEELKVAVTTEAERYALFNDSEALVDLHSFGQEEHGIRVLFAASRKDVADSYFKTLAAAGIVPLSLEPLSLAALRKIKESLPEEDRGVLLRSAQAFAIACWQEERVQVWRELEALPVSEDLAREILRTAGQNRPPEWLLFGPSQEEAEFLSEQLQAPITWIDAERESRHFTGGLLVREGMVLDLRPPVEASQSIFANPKFWVATGMSLGVVGMLVGHFALKMQLAAVENDLQRTQRQIAMTQQVASMPTNPQADAKRKGAIAFQDGLKYIKLFRKIQELIPADVWLTRLEIKENKLALEGYSLSQQSPSDLALSLQDLQLKISPPVVHRAELGGETAFQFQIVDEASNGQK